MAALYVLKQPEASNKVVVYPQVALLFELEDEETRKVMLNASEPKI